VYDGALSGDPKHIAKTGIFSYDHKDIHTKNDENRKRMGLVEKKGKLFWHGIPFEDLPPDLKTALYSQIAFMDEMSVDVVQRRRAQVFRAVS
jgi:hypothetical protein